MLLTLYFISITHGLTFFSGFHVLPSLMWMDNLCLHGDHFVQFVSIIAILFFYLF